MKRTKFSRSALWFWGPPLLLAASGLHTSNHYVKVSRGEVGSVGTELLEIPSGSSRGIIAGAAELARRVTTESVVSDTVNSSVAKLMAAHLRGRDLAFVSLGRYPQLVARPNQLGIHPNSEAVHKHSLYLLEHFEKAFLHLEIEGNKVIFRPPSSPEATFIMTPRSHTFLNHNRLPDTDEFFPMKPLPEMENFLVFVDSYLGQKPYQGNRRRAAFTAVEPDFMNPGGRFAGVGRHIVFWAVNPSPSFRILLSMTSTLRSDGENRIPPATVLGGQRVAFRMAGRGSARVFSPPLSARAIEGYRFVALDLGDDGVHFPLERRGLMKTFGTNIRYDTRRLVGFAREVSIVTEEEYSALPRMTALANFPADLIEPGSEYYGLYEDGWASEEVFTRLRKPSAESRLVVRGNMPWGPESDMEATVYVDGHELSRTSIAPGEFRLEADPGGEEGSHEVMIRFSMVKRLPDPDKRPVAARLSFLGFEQPVPESSE
ncbi:MAG: hypothetical protein ACK5AZ_08175 [Bryobacteraceae bacterium]